MNLLFYEFIHSPIQELKGRMLTRVSWMCLDLKLRLCFTLATCVPTVPRNYVSGTVSEVREEESPR